MRWDEQVCAFCGISPEKLDSEGNPPGVYIVIRISLPDPQLPSELAYTETAMCKECWSALGIEAALEHNRESRDIAGLEEGGA